MITFFHRNKAVGFSIDKVTQTIISGIPDKKEYYVPSQYAGILDIIQNIYFIFRHRSRHEINHITGDIHYGLIALLGCKSVLTIHDLVHVEYLPYSQLKKDIIALFWYRIPMLIATKVVCISEATKQQALKYTKRRDIIVIHNAVDQIFKKCPMAIPFPTHPKILIIGTSNNKNLSNTFAALHGIPCELRIIGVLSVEQVDALLSNSISYTQSSNLSEAEIVNEYMQSDIVSFISKYEGFGMVVIEANRVGRPVICSNIPVLKEVGGDAAYFVDPNDIAAIRKGFLELISDKDLRNSLVNNGYRNAERFASDIIKKKWLAIYEQLS